MIMSNSTAMDMILIWASSVHFSRRWSPFIELPPPPRPRRVELSDGGRVFCDKTHTWTVDDSPDLYISLEMCQTILDMLGELDEGPIFLCDRLPKDSQKDRTPRRVRRIEPTQGCAGRRWRTWMLMLAPSTQGGGTTMGWKATGESIHVDPQIWAHTPS